MDKNENTDATNGTTGRPGDFAFGIWCWSGRRDVIRIGDQQLSGTLELRFTGRAEDAVVADLRGAPRQDVLKKAMDELDAGKRDVTNLLSSIVAIAKTNFAIGNGFQPAVGNGDAENVTSKVVEDLVATAGMLRMDDPFFLPD